ncbi:hypothetical protein KBTX_01192 [wastewater metagenome]|uniref:Uncharacterized protein n=2 Tax=unclassified sequences TaxID=12908 RepID=A0A5B8RDK1_9ZZZZ|nr:hypothetical protein KBTEX_01192 [uncultured organism]
MRPLPMSSVTTSLAFWRLTSLISDRASAVAEMSRPMSSPATSTFADTWLKPDTFRSTAVATSATSPALPLPRAPASTSAPAWTSMVAVGVVSMLRLISGSPPAVSVTSPAL